MQPLAIQLYTLRDAAERDLPGTLERLGRIGFRAVEPASLHGETPSRFLRLLADAGLGVCSSHGMPFGDDAAAVLDQAAALGSPLVVVPFAAPDHFRDVGGVREVADALNAAAVAASTRGLALGYHNHFWEWSPLPDGTPAYELLVRELEPEVQLELDVYWAQVAGQDPAAVARAHAVRVTRLHLKDGPADAPASAMTACGDGVVDLAAAAAAAPRAAWHVAELDRCDGDMWDAVERSYAFLTARGISEGRP